MIDKFEKGNNSNEKKYMAIRSGQKSMPEVTSQKSLYYEENSYD